MRPESKRAMTGAHRATALLLLALAIFLGWEATKLRYYTTVGPGPGFFPIWLAAGLGVLALIMFAQTFVSAPEVTEEELLPGRQGAARILGAIAGLSFFIALLNPLGFRIVTFLLALGLIHLFGRTRLIVSVPVSALMSLGVYYVFSDLLKITLPIGYFGF